jgi:hypothetical protein
MLSAALGFAVLLAVAAPVDVAVAVSAAPMKPPCTVGGSTEEEVLAAAALKSARLSFGSVLEGINMRVTEEANGNEVKRACDWLMKGTYGGLITPTMPLWQWDGTAQ